MNYITPQLQKSINALYTNKQRALVNNVYHHALTRGNVSAHVYSSYNAQHLNKWYQQNQSSALHDASDSLLSIDIIDQFKTAVDNIIQLMNTM